MSEGSGRLNEARCPQFCRKRQNRLPHAPLRGAFGVIDPSASPARWPAHLQLQQMEQTMSHFDNDTILIDGDSDEAFRRQAALPARQGDPDLDAAISALEASWGR